MIKRIPKNVTLFKSFGFAIEGIKIAIKYNRNIRIHFVLAILAVILSFVFQLSAIEKTMICIIILLVISAEMINTAIEEIVDLVTQDYRQQAKYAKDVSAGMVLLVATGSVVMGVLIFLPHVFFNRFLYSLYFFLLFVRPSAQNRCFRSFYS